MTAPFSKIGVFKEIFKKYYNPLVNFVYQRYVHDYDLSADITRTTFVNIWKNKEDIVLETSVRNYLFKAVKNEALAYLNKNDDYATEVYSGNTTFGIIDNTFVSDIQSLLYQQVIFSAMNKMDAETRSIFEMYKFNGLTRMDIAVKLNLTKTKVSHQIVQAFQLLKEELENGSLFD